MMSSLWLWWVIFMFVLLVMPLGYGWGYRGWGAPYPRYIQRRRAQRASLVAGSSRFDHHAWGWRGDFVWVVVFVGIFWAVSPLWWR